MGIWKWMKHVPFSPLARSIRCRSGVSRKLPACVLIALLVASPLAAKPSFGFRIMPGYYIPVGDTLLKPGFGVSGSFDFFPVSYLGFFVDGEYVSIGPRQCVRDQPFRRQLRYELCLVPGRALDATRRPHGRRLLGIAKRHEPVRPLRRCARVGRLPDQSRRQRRSPYGRQALCLPP